MSCFSKFEETSLPPLEAFYSSLKEEYISVEAHKHALKVWQTFQLQNLGDYHDFYVKTDELLLADVFENFRHICMQNYGLDCTYVMTSPGLWQSSMLKMTEQPLELLTDVNMHLFIECGIRGGISTISHRRAEANNSCLPNFDPSKPSTFIIYLDANNLYGHAMSKSLPYGGFQWVSPEEASTDGVTPEWLQSLEDGYEGYVLEDNADEGYVLEVELDYL